VALVQKLNITACVIKGKEDVICTNEGYITCEVEGGCKRPGGVGDVLAGVMTAFLGWAGKEKGSEGGSAKTRPVAETIWGACAVVREATRRAYVVSRRSMGAGDVIRELDGVVEEVDPLFGEGNGDLEGDDASVGKRRDGIERESV
jgi:ATP-dependent NAD(P)H-hydrate dehydratase